MILSAVVLAGVILTYRRVLMWQGKLRGAREQTILEDVTTKEE